MADVRIATAAAALVVASSVLLAGCSDSGSPSSAPAKTEASAPAPQAPPPVPAPWRLSPDPAQLADDLVADELALRDPASPEPVLVAAARRQQAAYRVLGRRPDWDSVARPRIPPPLAEAYDRNVDARRQLDALNTPAATLPDWRIVEPAPSDDLLGYYREAQTATGVDWTYLAAINLIESRLGRITGVSTAGAQGPMQFLPSTFATYGEGGDINSPRDSIMAAGRFLAAHGFADDRDAALFRYNNSELYVRAVDDYAKVLGSDAAAFNGFYRWQVYYATTSGDVVLPVGYPEATATPVLEPAALSMPGDSGQVLDRLLTLARDDEGADPSARAAELSGAFLGTTYGANTLVGSESEPEQLVVDLERVDCFTYADYVEALKRAHDRAGFLDALAAVRYKDGVVGFATRKHFFTDWAQPWSNTSPALATDVTTTLSPNTIPVAKNLNLKDDGGTYLPGLPVMPRTLAYLPSASVDDAVVSQLRTGDYVGAYAPDGGLDVTHVGVFIAGPNGPVFRNASSLAADQRVVDTPLYDYLRTVPGIVVLRPVQ